ncbi:proteoglycan 4-like [Amia ocellicauda]|uniref:proteoglycan 4-like n=1 Tax=Amia ocellicauda TaxID=2972642 RepID=UPI003463C9E3
MRERAKERGGETEGSTERGKERETERGKEIETRSDRKTEDRRETEVKATTEREGTRERESLTKRGKERVRRRDRKTGRLREKEKDARRATGRDGTREGGKEIERERDYATTLSTAATSTTATPTPTTTLTPTIPTPTSTCTPSPTPTPTTTTPAPTPTTTTPTPTTTSTTSPTPITSTPTPTPTTTTPTPTTPNTTMPSTTTPTPTTTTPTPTPTTPTPALTITATTTKPTPTTPTTTTPTSTTPTTTTPNPTIPTPTPTTTSPIPTTPTKTTPTLTKPTTTTPISTTPTTTTPIPTNPTTSAMASTTAISPTTTTSLPITTTTPNTAVITPDPTVTLAPPARPALESQSQSGSETVFGSEWSLASESVLGSDLFMGLQSELASSIPTGPVPGIDSALWSISGSEPMSVSGSTLWSEFGSELESVLALLIPPLQSEPMLVAVGSVTEPSSVSDVYAMQASEPETGLQTAPPLESESMSRSALLSPVESAPGYQSQTVLLSEPVPEGHYMSKAIPEPEAEVLIPEPAFISEQESVSIPESLLVLVSELSDSNLQSVSEPGSDTTVPQMKTRCHPGSQSGDSTGSEASPSQRRPQPSLDEKGKGGGDSTPLAAQGASSRATPAQTVPGPDREGVREREKNRSTERAGAWEKEGARERGRAEETERTTDREALTTRGRAKARIREKERGRETEGSTERGKERETEKGKERVKRRDKRTGRPKDYKKDKETRRATGRDGTREGGREMEREREGTPQRRGRKPRPKPRQASALMPMPPTPPPSCPALGRLSQRMYKNYRRWQDYRRLTLPYCPCSPDTEALACFFIPVLRSLSRLYYHLSLSQGMSMAVAEWKRLSNCDRIIYYDMARKFMEIEQEELESLKVTERSKVTQEVNSRKTRNNDNTPKKKPRARGGSKSSGTGGGRRSSSTPLASEGEWKQLGGPPPDAWQEYTKLLEALGSPGSEVTGLEGGPFLEYLDQLCSDRQFVDKVMVESVINPEYLSSLFSPAPPPLGETGQLDQVAAQHISSGTAPAYQTVTKRDYSPHNALQRGPLPSPAALLVPEGYSAQGAPRRAHVYSSRRELFLPRENYGPQNETAVLHSGPPIMRDNYSTQNALQNPQGSPYRSPVAMQENYSIRRPYSSIPQEFPVLNYGPHNAPLSLQPQRLSGHEAPHLLHNNYTSHNALPPASQNYSPQRAHARFPHAQPLSPVLLPDCSSHDPQRLLLSPENYSTYNPSLSQQHPLLPENYNFQGATYPAHLLNYSPHNAPLSILQHPGSDANVILMQNYSSQSAFPTGLENYNGHYAAANLQYYTSHNALRSPHGYYNSQDSLAIQSIHFGSQPATGNPPGARLRRGRESGGEREGEGEE